VSHHTRLDPASVVLDTPKEETQMAMEQLSKAEEGNSLGNRIRQLREERGWSLSKLASSAGISRTYLWQLEMDRSSRPSLEIVERIMGALGVGYDKLRGLPELEVRREQIGSGEDAEAVTTLVLRQVRGLLEQRGSAGQKATLYAELSQPSVEYSLTVDYFFRLAEGLDWAGNELAVHLLEAFRNENRGDLEGAQAAYEAARERTTDPEVVGLIDWNLGNLLRDTYRCDAAYRHLSSALHQLESALSPGDAIELRNSIGWLNYRAGRYPEAEGLFKKARKGWERVRVGVGRVPEEGRWSGYRGLGAVYQRLGRFSDARGELEKARSWAAQRLPWPDEVELAWSTARLGFLLIHTGEWDLAEERLEEGEKKARILSLATRARESMELLETIILNNRGLLSLRRGAYDEALNQCIACLDRARQLEDARAMAFAHLFLGNVYAAQGNWREVLKHLIPADSEFRRMGIRYFLPDVKALLAEAYCQMNYKEPARAAAREALDFTTNPETASPYQETIARRALGLVHVAYDQLEDAATEFRWVVSKLREIQEPFELAKACLDYGGTLSRLGRADEARQRLLEAKEVADEIGAMGISGSAEKELGDIG